MPHETDPAATTDSARRLRSELRRGRDALAPQVAAFTEGDLARDSACHEWDISGVLSHLGSGAEIMIATLSAARAGEDPPGRESNEAIWSRWNAMSRAERAAGWRDTTERHLEGLEALSDGELGALRVPLAFLPAPADMATLLTLRLNEQALHTWDVEVAFDETAVIPESSAGPLIGFLKGMMGFLGKADRWPGGPARVGVSLSAPTRELTLVIGDSVALEEGPAGEGAARLSAPSETFLRLATGRLRAADASRVEAEGVQLDDLVTLFPGF